MSLTPTAFRELALWAVRHGLTAAATAAVLTAAFDADFSERSNTAQAAETTCNADATAATLHATRPKTSTERSREYRARKRVSGVQREPVACNVAVASLSLSLRDNIDSSRERETDATLHATPAVAGLMPLPLDWQPDGKSTALAAELLGEAGAANCLAKFRDHFEGSGKLMTASQWQARYRKWVRDERPPASAQRSLPLMRDLEGGAARFAPHAWKVEKARLETLERRRRDSG